MEGKMNFFCDIIAPLVNLKCSSHILRKCEQGGLVVWGLGVPRCGLPLCVEESLLRKVTSFSGMNTTGTYLVTGCMPSSKPATSFELCMCIEKIPLEPEQWEKWREPLTQEDAKKEGSGQTRPSGSYAWFACDSIQHNVRQPHNTEVERGGI